MQMLQSDGKEGTIKKKWVVEFLRRLKIEHAWFLELKTQNCLKKLMSAHALRQ